MRVPISEITTFLKCRQLWRYTGDSQMHLTSAVPALPLALGSGIHVALERFYRVPSQPPVETFHTWVNAQVATWAAEGAPYDDVRFAEAFELGEAMLRGYLDRYGQTPDADPDMTVLMTEQEFMLPIAGTDDGWLVGTLDGLCRDRTGKVWVLDHKTYTRAPTALHMNLQFLAYAWAVNQLVAGGAFAHAGLARDTRVYGVLWNGLRKQRPGPRVTTPLFAREWVMKNRDEIEIFGGTLAAIYHEMAQREVAIYPTIGRECERCEFQAPCYARQIGQDEHWLLKTNFRRAAARGLVYSEGTSDD